MFSEAWTEQTEHAATEMMTGSNSSIVTSPSVAESDNDSSIVETPPSSLGQPAKRSFFLTDRQMSRSLDLQEEELTGHDDRGGCGLA